MNNTDLHIHSQHSNDGELSISNILDISKSKSMSTISVTDHNSVKGVREAIEYGRQLNIHVIPGIEIDCIYKATNLHLLGYYIDHSKKDFAELEEDIYKQEMDTLQEKLDKLKEIGIVCDLEELLEKADNRVVSGEFIGEVVLSKPESACNELLIPYLKGGIRSNMPYLNFYRDFFAQGKPAHVPIEYMSLKDAISLVQNSNGIPVIAHPGDSLKNNEVMIDELIEEGIKGIEVFSSYHTPGQSEYFLGKALDNKLNITCGSDFHGKNKPGIEIGSCRCHIDENFLHK